MSRSAAAGGRKYGVQRSLRRIQSVLRIRPRTFCLITGAPRSGTTAVCRWLSSQDGVVGSPETRILVAAHHLVREIDRFDRLDRQQELLLADARRLVEKFYARKYRVWNRVLVDKEPMEPIAFPDRDYEQFIHNVRRLFPELKLLVMVRAPLDAIWSMSQRPWGTSLVTDELRTFSLETHIATWNANMNVIASLRDEPNVYICSFNRFVTEPRAEADRIRNFLGLRSGPTFVPKETKTVEFGPAERDQILHSTEARWEHLLPEIGLNHLQSVP